jgi:hypothetical protein
MGHISGTWELCNEEQIYVWIKINISSPCSLQQCNSLCYKRVGILSTSGKHLHDCIIFIHCSTLSGSPKPVSSKNYIGGPIGLTNFKNSAKYPRIAIFEGTSS